MRKIVLVLLGFSLLVVLGQSNSPFTSQEQQLLQTAGKEFYAALAEQPKDQALCSQYKNHLPSDRLSGFLQEQQSLIKYPAKLMGDWRKGGAIFNDMAKANCFTCHFGSPVNWGGNVGPSLEKYGRRGQSEAIQRYTYAVVYNSWAYFPCTVMYRFGVQGLLTPEEIADVVAYLLDPTSDFNTKPAATGSK
ncbi:sulfur oxidation c-type cytochrome SoxX [Calidithermus timidus]|jgi:sulfur-oxidizing protein SoxX|uniref:sulfur oxidation c-type cytochrome SoxX n=1 Tax=Calidithermus timidus TaxID=307124 RepID=UPI000365AC6D|nr:sulfur oxidation c-type cytochrome SoxX [Calidithermus timidus]